MPSRQFTCAKRKCANEPMVDMPQRAITTLRPQRIVQCPKCKGRMFVFAAIPEPLIISSVEVHKSGLDFFAFVRRTAETAKVELETPSPEVAS